MRLSGIKFWAVALFVVASIQVAVVSCSDMARTPCLLLQTRLWRSIWQSVD